MTLQGSCAIVFALFNEAETIMFIGLKIKKIRIGLNLTVWSLSQKLGVSRSYLTLMENGERRLPKRLIGKLAKALRISEKTDYEWYLEQELRGAGITDKKSHELIKSVLKMTSREKESLLTILKGEKIAAFPSKK